MKKNVLVLTFLLVGCVSIEDKANMDDDELIESKSNDELTEEYCTLVFECDYGVNYDSQEECALDMHPDDLESIPESCYEEQRDYLECLSQLKDCQELEDYHYDTSPCDEVTDDYWDCWSVYWGYD